MWHRFGLNVKNQARDEPHQSQNNHNVSISAYSSIDDHTESNQKRMLICIVCVKEMALFNTHAINHKTPYFCWKNEKKNELTYCVYSYGRRRSPLEYTHARVHEHMERTKHTFSHSCIPARLFGGIG